MSISAGLSLGESFAEFSALLPEAKPIRARWQFARKRLADGLAEALRSACEASGPQTGARALTISSWASEAVVARRLGTPAALISTEGFERWPQIALERAALRDRRLERDASAEGRSETWSPLSSILARHLQFGVAERSLADGSQRLPLDVDELLRVAAKLKLSKAPAAIAFLHARRNPANETKAAEILRGEGVRVVASHELAPAADGPEPEAELWWRTIAAAYASSALAEEEREIRAAIESAGGDWSVRWANDGEALSESPRLESAFGLETALARGSEGAETTLHFGLERFLAVGAQPIRHGFPWFRALRAEPASSRSLSLQPLSRLSSEGRLAPRFLFEARGYEPGPMVFGKSLQPTALDILSWRGRTAEVLGAPAFSSEKAQPRIAEALLTLGKATTAHGRRPDPGAIAEDLEALLVEGVIADLSASGRKGPFRATGPLAAALAPLLLARRPDWTIVFDAEQAEWAASEALAKWSESRSR